MLRILMLVGLLSGAAVAQDASVTDTNIVILLDTSGSMGEYMGSVQKMAAAQEALVGVLDQVPDNTRIGLLTFAGWEFDLSRIEGRKSQLISSIRATYPSGGTPLAQFTQQAGTALLAAREANHGYGIYKLIIVTDGQASDYNLEKYVADAMRRGIIIETIGVKMDKDHSLASNTYYMRADDPNSLKNAVTQVFAEAKDQGADAIKDFSDIAGFTDSSARGIIASLVNSQNVPIGEATAQTINVVGESGQVVNIQSPGVEANSSGPSVGTVFLWIMGVVAVIVVIALFVVVSGG